MKDYCMLYNIQLEFKEGMGKGVVAIHEIDLKPVSGHSTRAGLALAFMDIQSDLMAQYFEVVVEEME